MITAGPVTVVVLESTEAVRGFALGFEAGAMSHYNDAELAGHHAIWAANATVIEMMAMDRGFEFDVIDSCEDKLLVLISKVRKCPK